MPASTNPRPRPVKSAYADMAAMLDPVVFAQRAGIQPDPWQVDVLRSSARQQLLNASRQSGKSTTVAVLAMHRAIYHPGSLILVLSPSLRQSGELFRKMLDVYTSARDTMPADTETRLTLELANGSRVVSLPGKEDTIRGFSNVSLILIDEASRVADGLYQAIRPMMAVSKGKIVLLSTPWGQRGFFHHEWTEGGPDWQRVKITAYDVPRIDADWLEAERRRIPDSVFSSEYLCEFGDFSGAVFRSEDIAALFDGSPVEIWNL